MVADPLAGAEASATMEAFQAWWRRMGTTYTAKVAQRLSGEFEKRILEISEYAKVLDAAAATAGLPDEIEREQRQLAKVLRLMLLGMVLLVAGTLALGVLAIVGWLMAGIALAAVAVGWLVGSVITFMSRQQRLFQLKNARAQALSKADAAEYNIAAAIRDARRCGDAYGLLQLWSEALALFAGDPLGRGSVANEEASGPGTDHPLAIQFGKAELSEVEVARQAAGIRRMVFSVGWLSGAWETFLGAAGTLLGSKGTALLDEPQLLYRQRAVQEDTLLQTWVDAVERSGVPGTAGARLWEQIVSALHTTARQSLERLLGQVRTETGAIVPLVEFLGGLSAQVTNPTGFPTSLFSAAAITRDYPRPVSTWPQERAEGLSRLVVLVQESEAMTPEFLRPDAAWSAAGEKGFGAQPPEDPRAGSTQTYPAALPTEISNATF